MWRAVAPPLGDEPPEARAAFVAYLCQDIGDPFARRCVVKMAEATGGDIDQIDEWAAEYRWDARARAVDERAHEEHIADIYEARHRVAVACDKAAARAAWKLVSHIDELIERLLIVSEKGGAKGQMMAIKHALALVGIAPVKKSRVEITTDVAPRAMLTATEVADRLADLTDDQLALLQADDEGA